MTFYQQLTITLLDKLLIGLIIAFGAYFLSRSLERFKSGQAVSAELAKQRALKIAEIWNEIHDLQNAAARFSGEVGFMALAVTSKPNDLPEVWDNKNALIGRVGEVRLRIDAARFWLGSDMHGRCTDYVGIIYEFIHKTAIHPQDFPPESLKVALAKQGDSIFDFIKA